MSSGPDFSLYTVISLKCWNGSGSIFPLWMMSLRVNLNVVPSWFQTCRAFKTLPRLQGFHSRQSRKSPRFSCRTSLISSYTLVLNQVGTCTLVREPVINPAAAGLMPVVRCEASTGCHVLPVSAGTGINESLGTVTEEDEMSLCVIGSHPLANSLGSSAGVPVYVWVL